MKNIIIAAGGTGGHISPGVALVEYILDNKASLDIENVYIHSLKRNKDNPDLKEAGCEILWHNIPQLNWKIPFFIFHYIYYILKTFISFFFRKIDVVIAMGGYSCIPSLIYAIVFRKKIFLCEQNRVSGKVIRIFSKFAHKISYSFPTEDIAPNVETKVNGNPLRTKIFPDKKVAQEKNKHLRPKEKMNILVMGGSQGARQINNMVLATLNNTDITKQFNFRVLTGSNLYEEAKKKTASSVDLISYSQDMKKHYEWANLIIARSGAGVISEASLHALPMILVPYPFATDNHQLANAIYFKEKFGAIVINQMNEDNTFLMKILIELGNDRNSLVTMSMQSLSASFPNAAKDTIEFFLK
ncbi:MAG: glycosyltransferase [Leptospiraceae bacterium]|nr:glycosyltransferase [Leptospiraceae bacterium]